MKNGVTVKFLVDIDDAVNLVDYVHWYKRTMPSDLGIDHLQIETYDKLLSKRIISIHFLCDKTSQAENFLSSIKGNFVLHHYDMHIISIQ